MERAEAHGDARRRRLERRHRRRRRRGIGGRRIRDGDGVTWGRLAPSLFFFFSYLPFSLFLSVFFNFSLYYYSYSSFFFLFRFKE